MFLIMGIQTKTKEFKCSAVLPCHQCDGQRGYTVYDTYNVFHAFFLPLWTWGHRYHLKCDACGGVYQLKDSLASKDMRNCPQLSYWDLELAEPSRHAASAEVCQNCGYELEQEFEYCPKCGVKRG